MPEGPAARLGDPVAHSLPPVLSGGPASPDVMIGYMPAWRGVPAAGADVVKVAKVAATIVVQAAEAAAKAAMGTPGAPAAKAAEEATKAASTAAMAALIAASAAVADKHSCNTPLPPMPHGSGVVVDGSKTVQINFLPACRQGDTIVEPIGPDNKITEGYPTVNIGG